MLGRKYTWANNLATPTFEKLDRILMTTEWEEKFPLSTIQALTREVSDHTPLLLNSVESSRMATQPTLLQKKFVVTAGKRFLVPVPKTDTIYVTQKINRL
jgi:hypothetical protein